MNNASSRSIDPSKLPFTSERRRRHREVSPQPGPLPAPYLVAAPTAAAPPQPTGGDAGAADSPAARVRQIEALRGAGRPADALRLALDRLDACRDSPADAADMHYQVALSLHALGHEHEAAGHYALAISGPTW